jgi:hypothetical protein
MEGLILGFAALLVTLVVGMLGMLGFGELCDILDRLVHSLGMVWSLAIVSLVAIFVGTLIYSKRAALARFSIVRGKDAQAWFNKKALAIAVIVLISFADGVLSPGSASLFRNDFRPFFFIFAGFLAFGFFFIAGDGMYYRAGGFYQFPWIRFVIAIVGAVVPMFAHSWDPLFLLTLISGFLIIMD